MTKYLGRRGLTKAVVWTAPVVSVAAAAPVYAVSPVQLEVEAAYRKGANFFLRLSNPGSVQVTEVRIGGVRAVMNTKEGAWTVNETGLGNEGSWQMVSYTYAGTPVPPFAVCFRQNGGGDGADQCG